MGRPLTCFVVMGFGQKTDLATGRKLNLDATYQTIIKPTVEELGIECLRADEIAHSGVIDLPMYEQLLMADIVVADVSTANPNALYELGVRHALRPRTTIVIAEDKFGNYPFDLNHILIRSYEHLEKDIGYSEVMRFSKVLSEAIDEALKSVNVEGLRPDSPVYTFLQNLAPPAIKTVAAAAMRGAAQASGDGDGAEAATSPALATIIAAGERAIDQDKFGEARVHFQLALDLSRPSSAAEPGAQVVQKSSDPYLTQRLTLATYKSKQPDDLTALREALEILSSLSLPDTNDPETLGLAGAIEKRLFDKQQGIEHLQRAIGYYERGYRLKGDYYNGINLAFLLDVWAGADPSFTDADKIANHVLAGRIRRDLIPICDRAIAELRKKQAEAAAIPEHGEIAPSIRNELFWALATKAECCFGLEQLDWLQRGTNPDESFWKAERDAMSVELTALAAAKAKWMTESAEAQLEKLRQQLTLHQGLFRKLA